MSKVKTKSGKDAVFTFEGQRDDEVVIKVFRRHIISMRKGFIGLLIPFALLSIPPLIWQTRLELFLLPIAGLVIGVVIFLYHYMLWYYSIFILTNQRLRQVVQRGFFGTNVLEIKLSKVSSISYSIPGLTGELFGFGTLLIQTYVGDLTISLADKPSKLYNILQDTIDKSTDNGKEEFYEED